MCKFHCGMVGQFLGAPIARVVMFLTVLGVFAGSAPGEVYVVDYYQVSICSPSRFDCADQGDAQPGDGVAERILGGGQTTLRAAIEEANALEGPDVILLPEGTHFQRTELPPLTDPDGVTIISMGPNPFILDGSLLVERQLAYRDLIQSNFGDLDDDMSEDLTYTEARDLDAEDVLDIEHNLGGLQPGDFNEMDANNDGFLTEVELSHFRGTRTGIRIQSPNNEIIGVSIVNFGEHGIEVSGEGADNNIIQGCLIGLTGTEQLDRENARALSESFEDADGNGNGTLSLGEARTVLPGLSPSAFERLDGDGDGQLSTGELDTAGALLDTEIAQMLLDDFATADADGNDVLNIEEAQTVIEGLTTEAYDRVDLNANGQLSQGELNLVVAGGDDLTTENGNRLDGIAVNGGADNTLIGGVGSRTFEDLPAPGQDITVAVRNIVGGNGNSELIELLDAMGEGTGIYISVGFGNGIRIQGTSTTNTQVIGNNIGVDASGINQVPNGYSGVVVEGGATDSVIGGINPGEGNLIAENGADVDGCGLGGQPCGNTMPAYFGRGIYMNGGATTGNSILGNTVRDNRTGGIYLVGVTDCKVGDTVAGAGNTVSGHFDVNLSSGNIRLDGCSNILVADNVSTNSNLAMGIIGGSNLDIGKPGFGNVFSSSSRGVTIAGGIDITLQANHVGLDEAGTGALPNSTSGIYISDSFNAVDLDNIRIGGVGVGEGNVISGNSNDGIVIHDMTSNPNSTDPIIFIEGNLIGTNAAGTSAVPNLRVGIRIGPAAIRVRVGGTQLDGDGNNLSGNTISGNGWDGVRVARRLTENGTPDNIQIFGNRIGLAAAGTASIPNTLSGVALLQVDEEVKLGGFGAGENNIISGNGRHGVRVKGGEVLDITSFATIRGNTIYGNALKGISLEEAANDQIEAPAVVGVTQTSITGTAPPNTTVDVFADAADEGRIYFGATTADGNGDFTLAIDVEDYEALTTGATNNLTATATDVIGTGSTSEFSAPLSLTAPTIDTHPVGVTVIEGQPFSLMTAASGSEPISYQWEFLPEGAAEFQDVVDDAVVSGAMTPGLNNSGARLGDAGSYRCVASNIIGDTGSAVVTVTVVPVSTNTVEVSTLSEVVDGDSQTPAHLLVDPGEDGLVSLREAMMAANGRPGPDTITFTVNGVLALESGLPTLNDMSGGTTLDGGGLVTLDGSALGGTLAGIQMTSAGNMIAGLTLVGFPGNAVDITGANATGNVVTGCFIGTDGTTVIANGAHGVEIRNGASDNTVGGAADGEGNVISGNEMSGVALSGANVTGNWIMGNLIGVNGAGSAGQPNGAHGVLIQGGASDNSVGGAADGEGNQIGSNSASGVFITGEDTMNNSVFGNSLGLNAAGEPLLGNVNSGVGVDAGASDNQIGGLAAGEGNTIGGNAIGVRVTAGTSTGNAIRGNSITGNLGSGIDLVNGGNGGIGTPAVTLITVAAVTGSAPANSTVDLYLDDAEQAAEFLATTTADSAGVFTASVDMSTRTGRNVTAIATDAGGNSSEISEPRLVDLEPPEITLLGDAAVSLECGVGAYEDAGVTAEDDVDGDVTGDVEVTITLDGSEVSSVDTSAPGVYTIRYEVTDNAGQAATPVERVVTVADTTAPVITLTGNTAVTVECGVGFTDPGATATDNCDGDVTVASSGSVDTSVPGVHMITYTASDSAGNDAAQVTRTVNVVDIIPPVVTLLGPASVTVECGGAYAEQGATAMDSCSGDITGDIVTTIIRNGETVPAVDTTTRGTYTIRYGVTDSSQNAATEVIRIVEVVDTTPPVLTLLGEREMTVSCGMAFSDPGAQAVDDCDGDLPVITSGPVDTSEPGEYTVSYSASDSSGNAAVPAEGSTLTRTVRVVDDLVPVITLNGDDVVSVDCGGLYEEAGATATDNCDGDLSADIQIAGSVDTSASGEYVITYNVSDSNGNVAQQRTRRVIVGVCPQPCEIQCENDPDNEVDADGDGLSACEESCLGTSDNNIDTDGDGIPDGVEAEFGADPSTPDAELDLDGDGFSQLEEFIFDSNPLDPNDPATSFFVSNNGANAANGGSSSNPWGSIEYALSQVSPSADNPVRLILADGNYPEDVVLPSWVTLVGASGALPRIEGTIFGADNSGLEDLEIAAFSGDDVMLVLDDVAMTVTNVVFRGSAARPAAGILADGAGASGSVIDGCLFTSLSVGIDVGGALPRIRRCTFEDTSIAGIFVRATANIPAGASLGNVNNPSTGSNLFSGVVEGRAIINELDTRLLAQRNDWGSTNVDQIKANLITGNVEIDPVLSPGTAADTSSLFVTVWTAANQTRVNSARVTATDSSGASVSVTENRNGVYAFSVLRSGTYAINVSAFGFEEEDATVSLTSGALVSHVVALQSPIEKEGGIPGCSPSAAASGAPWSDLLLVVFLLAALLVMQGAGGRVLKRQRR